MKNCRLLFEKNNNSKIEYKFKNKLKLKNKCFIYEIKVGDVFNGDHIYEIISVVNYVKNFYRQKIPIVIYLGEFEFYDKLVYIILESIVYYLNKIEHHHIEVHFKANHNIWTEGIRYSPLVNSNTLVDKYMYDLNMNHFRKYIPNNYDRKKEFISDLFHDIYCFLVNNSVEEATSEQLSEALIELVGNASEHGNSECILDIDITATSYGKENDDGVYYGMNAVVLNYSSTLFYEPLKNKLNNEENLSGRYENVLKAKAYHMNHQHDNYCENDFYTISSFQHKISGSTEKDETGGTGLTRLLESLEDNSDTHLCYMLSGRRILFFDKKTMVHSDNNYVGFNQNGDYFSSIPDNEVFSTIKTYFPGVAYNLNYAIKKE